MRIRKILSVALGAGALLAASALPASAEHIHVRLLGNGQCVVLAANGGEAEVELPHAGGFPAGRRHPLHVNVHLGKAGMRGGQHVVWVQGSAGDLANCSGYVNG